MLGRKNFTREEIDHGRAAVEAPLGAHKELAGTVAGPASAELAAFDAHFFNTMMLTLDRPFVRGA